MSGDNDTLTSHDWSRVFALAWLDKDFKSKLEKNPVEAIAAHPELGDLKGKAVYIPHRPVDLSDEQLQKVRDGAAKLPSHSMCGFECC